MKYNVDSWIEKHNPFTAQISNIISNSASKLTYQASVSTDLLNLADVDYKEHIRRQMAQGLCDQIVERTKFTAVQDPYTRQQHIRASVYVFSGDQLKKFIEDIINVVK